jgi:penicillin amidase
VKKIIKFGLSLVGPVAMIVILTMPIGPLAGGLGILQPIGGIFDVGRSINEPRTQAVSLPGLTADVTVLVDQWGIPHIYGATVHDAMMALGYMHAKDRLFQMVMQNYLASGRISEIVGGYANSSDRFYRTIGLERAAQRTLDWHVANTANPDVAYALDGIDAEVAGVNAFINSMTSTTTPFEFKILGFNPQQWTRLDIFIWAKMMAWGLSGGIYDLYRQWVRSTIGNDTMYNELFPDVMPYEVPIVPEQTNLSIVTYPNAPGGFKASSFPASSVSQKAAEEAMIPQEKLQALMNELKAVFAPPSQDEIVGSNNWAVGSSKSATGLPILANDPHLGYQAPSLWYEAQIVVPGQLNVMGVTLPGLPAVLLGHNDHIAWGLTNVGADVLDIFVEQLNPANTSQYMYNGLYRPLTVYDETIHTKEGVDITFKVKESVHGPLIDSAIVTFGLDTESAPNIAMNWTGDGVTHEVMSVGILNRAVNLTGYYNALYWWDSPPQNIIYADDAGHIAITCAGRYPIRSGYTGEYPVTALNDSIGMVSNIPYAYIPRSVDPTQGYLQSANQRSIDPSEYGFQLLGPFDDGYRGRRIDYLLDHTASVTIDDMKMFQADSLEVSAQQIVPYAVSAWDSEGDGNATINGIVDQLRTWNYVMDVNVWTPTLWLHLKDAIHYMVFDELRSINASLPLSRTPILEMVLRENYSYYLDDHTTTGQVESRDQILVRALHRAYNDMIQEYGADTSNWIYGVHHRVYVDHLADFTYIGGGPQRGQNTLNAAGGWRVTHGPSWRMVADLSNIQKSYGVYPGGQSGNMFSPHWDDLFKLWYAFNETTQQYGYHRMYFYPSAAAFQAADTGETMIETTITFVH